MNRKTKRKRIQLQTSTQRRVCMYIERKIRNKGETLNRETLENKYMCIFITSSLVQSRVSQLPVPSIFSDSVSRMLTSDSLREVDRPDRNFRVAMRRLELRQRDGSRGREFVPSFHPTFKIEERDLVNLASFGFRGTGLRAACSLSTSARYARWASHDVVQFIISTVCQTSKSLLSLLRCNRLKIFECPTNIMGPFLVYFFTFFYTLSHFFYVFFTHFIIHFNFNASPVG